MKVSVNYLPDNKNGPIIKAGATKIVPETSVEHHQDPGVLMPNTNIARVSKDQPSKLVFLLQSKKSAVKRPSFLVAQNFK